MQLHDRDSYNDPVQAERARQIAAYEEKGEDFGAAWALLGVMIVGKVLIMIAVIAMAPSRRAMTYMVAYNWSWMVLVGILCSGPALFWWRLRRVRRKRELLVRSEFQVD